jgi:hypothetical protein
VLLDGRLLEFLAEVFDIRGSSWTLPEILR